MFEYRELDSVPGQLKLRFAWSRFHRDVGTVLGVCNTASDDLSTEFLSSCECLVGPM